MKFNPNKGEDGYGNYLAYRPITVYLDGKRLSNALSIDVNEGWIDFHPKQNGKFVIGDDGSLVVERVYGVVRVSANGVDFETPPPIEPEDDA